MFDGNVFIKDTCKNVVENGKVIGYEMQTHITYYRGEWKFRRRISDSHPTGSTGSHLRKWKQSARSSGSTVRPEQSACSKRAVSPRAIIR